MTREEFFKKVDATPLLTDPDELDLEIIEAMRKYEAKRNRKSLGARIVSFLAFRKKARRGGRFKVVKG